MAELTSIILAAGQGSRMKSKYPKVLHQILGRPMLQYVIDAANEADSAQVLVVVGFEGQQVIDAIGQDIQYIWQTEQRGTGHAVMMAEDVLKGISGDLLVLYGDTPLLKADTLKQLVRTKRESKAAAAVLTTELANPSGYGRILRNDAGNIIGIIEDKDASAVEKAINEVNTGVYCFEISILLQTLKKITPHNAQGEYYLTDVIKILAEEGSKIAGLITNEADEVMGPNDRIQLAGTENYLKTAINQKWMKAAVSIVDPSFTYIGPEVEIGRDTIIHPGTFLSGKTKVGENCSIGPHTKIIDSTIGSDSSIQFSLISGAQIGEANNIGPYAYIRPGTVSDEKVKFGDFVEVKNCRIAKGSKVPHLTYLGDTEVGAGVNIGAGTITCNYDGIKKHKTVIKDGAFIGSNANLVAPVVIGERATVGAGSTITKEVPDKALAIARSKQEVLTNWVSPRERAKK